MRRLMKKSLCGQLLDRIDSDLPLACGVTLTVAVRIGEWDLFNVEGGKCSLGFPLRQAWRRELVADGLTNGEPSRLVHKAGKSALAVLAFALRYFFANLASDRHAKDQGSLAAFDGAA